MTLLDEILAPAALTTVFQPIVAFGGDGAGTLHGYEALTRGPRDTHASRADVLFEYVRRKRAEPDVDRACVLAALRAARSLPTCPHLSVNVHAATLGRDPAFVELVIEAARAHGFSPQQLIIEVVEQSSQWNTVSFAAALEALRAAGVLIALDDLGLGHSNLHMVIEVRPDYLKLDRYFVTGATTDPARRAILRTMHDLARAIGGQVVAEGVETHADLAAVTGAGIGLVQGYLLSPPRSAAQHTESPVAWTDRALLSA
jgi:EAL domain-containing protein (putative c-di-GMP-specific phosphodiesterase class I)